MHAQTIRVIVYDTGRADLESEATSSGNIRHEMKLAISIAQVDVVTSEPGKNLEKGEAGMVNTDLVDDIPSKMKAPRDRRPDLCQLD